MIISRFRRRALGVVAAYAALCAGVTASAGPAGAITPAPPVQAHRGVHSGSYADTPENSLYAYQAADALGVFDWETDVRFTSDNVPYQMHDANLDRTTTCTGPISARNSRDFRNGVCKYKDGSKIESFYWTMKLAREVGAKVTVEVKVTPTSAQVTALRKRLTDTGTTAQVIFSSFDRPTLAVLRSAFRNNHLMFISTTLPSGITVKRLGATYVAVKYTELTATRVLSFHNQGIKVVAWTPNDLTGFAAMRAAGVDVICTDEVELYLASLRPAPRR